MSSSYRGMYIVQPPRLVALFFFPPQNSWDSLGLADAGEKRREAAGGGGGGGRQRINDRIVRGWLSDAEDTFNGESAKKYVDRYIGPIGYRLENAARSL